MQRFFALASTIILGSTCVAVGCSNSPSTMPAPDSGGSGSGSSSGSSSGGGSGSSSGSSSGSTDSGSACAPGQGTTVQAKWDFAVSAATMNGGKGQVLSIHVCDTVVWTNDDNLTTHSIMSTGTFAFSTPMAAGTTAGVVLGQVQFPTAGTFTYECGVHLTMMIGQVTVQ